MLSDAFAYPRRGDQWLRRIGIGGILILTSFLIVPWFVLFGYLARVIRSVAVGQETPPDFEDIGGLAVDGVKMNVVTIAYTIPLMLIPFFAGMLGEALSLGAHVEGTSDPGAGPVVTGVIGLIFLVSIPVGIVSAYSIPAAVSHFAYTRSMKAAFDIKTVVGAVGFSKPYFKVYLLILIVSVVLYPFVAMLSVVLIGFFVAVYYALAASYMLGTGYAASRDLPQDGSLNDTPASSTPAGGYQQETETVRSEQATTFETGARTATDHGTENTVTGTCPDCGRSVGPDASFCPDCGSDLPHNVTSQASEASSTVHVPSQPDHGTDDSPDPAGEPDEDTSASGTGSPSQVSHDQIYTDETGAKYVETGMGPDKRLHTDSDGHHYYQRGQATRATYAGMAIICVGFAGFAMFALPGAPVGPSSPRGNFIFTLIEAIPFGNVIISILALWIGYRLAHTAYTGREYIAVEDPE